MNLSPNALLVEQLQMLVEQLQKGFLWEIINNSIQYILFSQNLCSIQFMLFMKLHVYELEALKEKYVVARSSPGLINNTIYSDSSLAMELECSTVYNQVQYRYYQ